MVKVKFTLDYNLIKQQINRLLVYVPNKLEHEPRSPSFPAQFLLLATVQVVANTFKTITFLCSEKSPDWRHRPEMSLTVPPLIRTILDAVYTLIFAFEDLSNRAEWYMMSGTRELAEYIDRAHRDYGSDPIWEDYFTEAVAGLKGMIAMMRKSDAEIRSTQWWPIPQRMINQCTQPMNAAFFKFLDDWFYREFSQIAHMSVPGLIHSAGALRDRDPFQAKLIQMRGYHAMQAVMLLVVLYSEIEAELKLGAGKDLKEVWAAMNEHFPDAKEVYGRRNYSTRL